MIVTALDWFPVRWSMAGGGAAGRRRDRSSVIVRVRAHDAIGLGEAAPLDDDVAAVVAELSRVALPLEADELLGGIAGAAARFAIETAIFDALARQRGVTVADLIVAATAGERARPAASIAINAVVDDDVAAAAAVARGVTTLKVKLDGREDVARLAAIRAAAPHARLRGDANSAWHAHEVRDRLAVLAAFDLEYVEEPAAIGDWLWSPLPCPVALDESLARRDRDDWLDRALRGGAVAALLLKPTVLGGAAACAALAARARAAGVDVVVTHALEGPVGTAAAIEVARALAPTRACGLDRHPALAAWPIDLPQIGAAAVTAPRGPGLGIGVDTMRAPVATMRARYDVDRALSIADAAAEAGDRLALIDERGALTFRELADGATGAEVATVPVIATHTRATVVRVMAALDRRMPIAMIHARIATAAQEAQAARIAASAVPDETAVVLFTSGSTAEPKAVALSRTALVAAAEASAAHLGWRDDDRWLCALPMAHAGGLAVVVRCLIARKTIVMSEGDGRSIAHALEQHGVTIASLVPAQLAALLDDEAWRPPPRLRAVLLGGAAAPDALVARARARGVAIATTYGMTETFGQVATSTPGEVLPAGAVGRALPGVTITAGTRAQPAPIAIEGPMRATAYLDDVADLGALVTRDLGFVEDGVLYVVGRVDDVIVTGGEKVHPAAVEAALARVEGVAEVCVFGIPDSRWGQLVAAAIVVGPGFVREAFDRTCGELGGHARPRRILVRSRLPALSSGKPDRRALASEASETADAPGSASEPG